MLIIGYWYEYSDVPEYEYLVVAVTSMLVGKILKDPTGDMYSLLKENNYGHDNLTHLCP